MHSITNTFKTIMGNDDTQSTGPYFRQSSCYIGKKEFSSGLTYVACSRVRQSKDLFKEPFPYDHLSNLSKSQHQNNCKKIRDCCHYIYQYICTILCIHLMIWLMILSLLLSHKNIIAPLHHPPIPLLESQEMYTPSPVIYQYDRDKCIPSPISCENLDYVLQQSPQSNREYRDNACNILCFFCIYV